MGLWHPQKSFLIHERNNNSSSAATAGNPGWFGKGTLRARTSPHRCPQGLSKPLEKNFPHEESPPLPWRHQLDRQQVLAGSWDGREGRMEGRASPGVTQKPFFSTKSESQPPAGQHCAVGRVSEWMHFAERLQKGANETNKQHHAKFSELGLESKANPPQPRHQPRSHLGCSRVPAMGGSVVAPVPIQHFVSPGTRTDLQGPDTGV